MQKLRPRMFTEAESSRAPSNIVLQILIFIAVFIVIALAEGIGATIFALPAMITELLKNGDSNVSFQQSYDAASSVMNDWKIMTATLFCTVFGTLLSIVYCRFIEKRSLGSMGIRKNKAVQHYLQGMLTGLILMSAAVGLSALTGASKISAVSDIHAGIILVYFLGWLVQGMSEEFIFRGYLMNTVGGKHSAAAALAVSSVAFACAHLSNTGISLLAFANLVLFAVFAGLYMICFDDIWGACAIHSIWNFTQGNIFGISVSGTGESSSLLRTAAASSRDWLTGGDFGIEGSIFTTIVLAAASVIIIIKIRKTNSSESAIQPSETV